MILISYANSVEYITALPSNYFDMPRKKTARSQGDRDKVRVWAIRLGIALTSLLLSLAALEIGLRGAGFIYSRFQSSAPKTQFKSSHRRPEASTKGRWRE